MPSLNRRQFLSATTAAGALLFARPMGALAAPLGTSIGTAADRASRLFPGTRVAHADLHNHSLASDGSGDPAQAFDSMRSRGLDIAALTDHATTSKFAKPPCGDNTECHSLLGIDETSWRRAGELADAAQADGSFTALRGFEWSSPTLGHINVWFSQTWIDPLHTAGTSTGEGLGQHLSQGFEFIPASPLGGPVDTAVRAAPTNGATMRPFYEWLNADPSTPAIGGGTDAIAGFNHPGREPGRFGYFAYDARLRDRLVSMEMFNRKEDYLFEGTEVGQPSPLVECLRAGWRPGLIGVTDEHGTVWGHDPAKGRAGIWIDELSRDGVRRAMLNRRFFATVIEGLRLDAAATTKGKTGRMGSTLPTRAGLTRFEVDIDRGADWVGKRLLVQVLVPSSDEGALLPAVAHTQEITVPAPTDPVVSFSAHLRDAPWAVLRVTDPALPADHRAPGTAFADTGKAIAYASPFYFDRA